MAELVAKTAAAIVVTNELTTVLDWTNIERLSDFTIVVVNAAGGSANDITDVQIDTSKDGGLGSKDDVHPCVPTVPIASGKSGTGSFVENAHQFVRVRLLCDTGEDTTAEAILLADTVVPRVCTLADVKDRLGITETDNDFLVNRIIAGLEEIFNAYTRRKLLVTAADVTEYYTAESGEKYLHLRRYPSVSITSIKESFDYEFDSTQAQIADTDYRLVRGGKNGILLSLLGDWFAVEDGIQVIYRGGYCSAGVTPNSLIGELALPSDIREAAILQASFVFKRKDDIGLTSVSFDSGSISKYGPMELLPMVKQILDKYRRPQL